MKVFLSLLSITSLVLCEVPPYPSRNFRPHPLLLPVQSRLLNSYGPPNPSPIRFIPPVPQHHYGVPNSVESLDIRHRPALFSNSINQKQTISPQNTYRPPNTYGPPNNDHFNLQQKQPQDTYGAPQQTPNKFQFNQQQNGFNTIPQNFNNFRPNVLPQQNTYETPSNFIQNNQNQNTILGNNYGAPRPNSENFNQQQNFQRPSVPQNTYNSPINPPQTQYGTPENNNVEVLQTLRTIIAEIDKGQLTTQYLPTRESNIFQNPSGTNLQALPFRQPNNFRNNNNNVPQKQSSLTPSQQYLPIKEANDFGRGFEWTQSTPSSRNIPLPNLTHLPGNNLDFPRGSGKSLFPDLNSNIQQNENNVEIQHLDIRTLYPPLGTDQSDQRQPTIQKSIQDNSQNTQSNIDAVSEKYLPPTTTSSTVLIRPASTTPRSTTTPQPTTTEVEYEQSTEPVVNPGGPNVAVATAVAGGPTEQQFYLVQPDGQLQRVVYQKTKQEGDADNEYVADYYFQNIQAEPNIVYAPLITLG